MSPKHSIDFCPICGGGLCGIRICGTDSPHGLVICDECEAIWLEPDTTTAHQYPSIEDAKCPVCSEPLWGKQSRWADTSEIESLGWEFAVNPDLDATSDEEIA